MPTVLNIAKWLFGKRTGMFGRYTEHARRTIFFARWEALHTSASFIEPDHIALGMIRDSWLMSEFLKEFAVDELRKKIALKFPVETAASDDRDIPLSSSSKRLLRFAAAAADSLIDIHIGDEHLLLALLQTGGKSESVFSSVISAKLNSRDIRSRIKAIPMEIRRESGNAQGAGWREAGIPQGYTVSQLLYNPAAETLVLEVKALESDVCPKRLFVRHRTSERYEEVGSPGEDISYESPATCEKLPIVMFNSNKHYRPSKGNSGSADWDGTYILNLTTKELTLCLSNENFVVPSPYDERGWVKEVRAISDDGLHAYVIVGLGRRKNAKEVYYDYHFAKLDLGTKQLELITHLKNTFF